MLSKEYKAAVETHNKASRIYSEVLAKYRNLEIGDEEFLAARAVKVEADSAFDVAFDIEAEKPEEEAADVETADPQLALEI